jgi:two-component system sensor histidine kinase EvgS
MHTAVDPTVQVRLDLRGERAVLAVSDNGVGIPPEDMPRLFQPFFSRKAVQGRNGLFPPTIEGTGLGLSVCQVLVERAGGELTISSQPGLGTTVTICLPVVIGAVAITITPGVVADPPTLLAATQTRVVVLDDNDALCQLLHEALSEAGFLVRSHIDPRQFLAEEKIDEIDLLILDWQMPRLTGGDVLMRLGNSTRSAALRVLVVVIEGVMLKPYRLGDLIARVTGT